MSNALQIYSNFDTMQRTATALYNSGYFKDAGSQAQAIVKVMAGAELGLPPFASMAGIHIVQGKPVLGSNIIATLVKNDPRYDYRVKVSSDTECILTWYEDGKPVGEAGFTITEANTAGLTGKSTWKQYPSDMLFARAISRGARRFAPGIFGGAPVYTPDEMNVDTDEDGYIEGVAIEDGKGHDEGQDMDAAKDERPEPEPAPAHQPNGNGKKDNPTKRVTIPMLKELHIKGKAAHGDDKWESVCTDINAGLGVDSSKAWPWETYWEVMNGLDAQPEQPAPEDDTFGVE
jgi:hypothetical protein